MTAPNLLKHGLSLFIIVILLTSCAEESGRLVKHNPTHTGIQFNNTITENDSINIFDFSNIYNGGGVGVGDFNNDGLQDLYFTGNMVSNKLYLNKGDFRFEDITDVSKTGGDGIWSRGVAVVDINNDGLLDMYVCATAKRNPHARINKLYVNQGVGAGNTPVFKDMAAEYGLADTSQSTMGYFFDYDNDEDLDLYIGVNHIIVDEYANTFRKRNVNGEHPSTGRLYRNDWNDSLKHGFYTDVSREAGILVEGYTHAANIADFNNDGWMDIFVANDYISSNVLYINNKNGTFTDRVTEYFKHAAANSMGSDMVDINNDGLDDLIEVDMAPQDNYRKKMFLNPISYQSYQNTELYGYQYQYVRNILQVNMGHTIAPGDSVSHPVFGDAGFYAGIAETDWSWTPVVADFDNDGYRDIIFTNGFPKDITDKDFITYRTQATQLTSKMDMLAEIPEVRIHNYAYRNNGQLTFSDQTSRWGLDEPNFSNGAVYADLDNDGDLDLVINNIDDPASVYENKIIERPFYLDVKCKGNEKNRSGIGAKIIVHQGDKVQHFVNNPYRGYISSVSPIVHFGLGVETLIDSVEIYWPGNRRQVIHKPAPNQLLTVDIKDAVAYQPANNPVVSDNWFSDITKQAGINYIHEQRDFVDFNIQKLLLHKLSEYTPGIAAGDINGDGLDDFITGGVTGHGAMVFTQQVSGQFIPASLLGSAQASQKGSEDRGLLLFDADNDADLDLYVAAGGYQYESGSQAYTDTLYINDGRGKFQPATDALPLNLASKFCVRATDYDKDGDLDLFIASRVEPHRYPRPVSSFIYRNDSKNGVIKFTDVTKEIAPSLVNIGLACDALFSDYDNDGWTDLIIAGEWMPLTFLHNEQGKFVNATSGLDNKSGWWNSLAAGDFDNDGDIDYVAANHGLNSFYRASETRPVGIYARDFDDNGSYDAIPSVYLLSNLEQNGTWAEYPAHGRDDMVKQILGTRREYTNYKSYATAPMTTFLPEERRKDAMIRSANYMASAYIQNDGSGKFTIKELPAMAQLSALNGMVADDFDGDGNLDVAFNTNDYGPDPTLGRFDALNGLLLKGDGAGNFRVLSMLQSGIYINGNGKALCKLRGANNDYLVVSTMNRGPVQVFRGKKKIKIIPAEAMDQFVIIELANGKKQRAECYYGSSFLSQGSRFFAVPVDVKSVVITNMQGKERKII